jgi:hypothetical protein
MFFDIVPSGVLLIGPLEMFLITGYEFSLLAGDPEPDRAGVRHPAPGPQELPPHRLKGQARPLPTLAFQLTASSPCIYDFPLDQNGPK